MPMPNPRLLDALLDYYSNVKETKKNTTLFGAALNVGQTIGLVSDYAKEREPKTADLKSMIKSAKSVDNWIDIALLCGMEARAAQRQRTWKTTDCDYAKVMHACRSYIIDTLTRDQKLEALLRTDINQREHSLAQLSAIYYQEAQKNYIPKLQKEQYYIRLIELADLGHLPSAIKASQYKDCLDLEMYTEDNFAKLAYKEGLCPSVAKCYQSTYYVIYYLEEGLKIKTRDLTANKTEMHFTTYIKYLNSHKTDTPDALAAELIQNDEVEARDFPDERVVDFPISAPIIAPSPRKPTPKPAFLSSSPNSPPSGGFFSSSESGSDDAEFLRRQQQRKVSTVSQIHYQEQAHAEERNLGYISPAPSLRASGGEQ